LLFKIRGIYATALTAALMDEELRPTQASEIIRLRFNLPSEYAPHDVMIIDNNDQQGVRIRGKKEAVEKVLRKIREKFPYAIIWRCFPLLNSIYIGVVKEIRGDCEYLIDLGDCEGILRTTKPLNEGMKVLVCVKRTYYGRPCELSEEITLVGRYARIFLNGRHSVSPHIKDPNRRAELLALAYSLPTGKWGIRWRSSAEHGDLNVMAEEVQKLIEEGNRILKMNLDEGPKLLKEGEEIAYVRFTLPCKLRADEIRNEVVPTVIGHHYIKSNIGNMELVDFSEFLIDKGFDRSRISRTLHEYIRGLHRPQIGQQVRFIHHTLRNETIHLTPGILVEHDKGLYVVKRVFKTSGVHDGLGTKKRPGDYSLTYLMEGAWWLVHEYHREGGEYIGMYCNVNTPIEMWDNKVYYVDLAVDVVKDREGNVKIIDMNELEEARNKEVISEELYNKAVEMANFISESLKEVNSARELAERLSDKCEDIMLTCEM